MAMTDAQRLKAEKGWTFKQDGDHWRRVVPSPEPKRIFELRPIKWLLEMGAVVIAAGGGGIPTVYGPGRKLGGIEAVIDKDLCSELLARELGADLFIMATDVDAVYPRLGQAGRQSGAPGQPRRPARLRLPGRIDGAQGRRRLPFRRTHWQARGDRGAEGPGGDRSRRGRNDGHQRSRVGGMGFEFRARACPGVNASSQDADAAVAVVGDDFIAKALRLSGVRKSDLISVAGPDGLTAIVRLCQAGFQNAEYAWRATCVVADRPRDLLLLAGRMDAEALGQTVRLTARLLRDGGLLVAELARPEDQAVLGPALATLGRCAGAIEVSEGLVAVSAVRRRPRAAR